MLFKKRKPKYTNPFKGILTLEVTFDECMLIWACCGTAIYESDESIEKMKKDKDAPKYAIKQVKDSKRLLKGIVRKCHAAMGHNVDAAIQKDKNNGLIKEK